MAQPACKGYTDAIAHAVASRVWTFHERRHDMAGA